MLDNPQTLRRIGIFLPNWVGDVCMATPVLRAVSDRFRTNGNSHVVGIMRPNVAKVLEGTSWLDEVWLCQKKARQPDHSGRSLLRRMRAEPLDAALLLPNSLRTAALAWLGGARLRIGFARDWRGPLLTHRVPMPHLAIDKPLVFRFLRLAEHLGCDSRDTTLELATTREDEARADQVWEALRLPAASRVITMNCGSANSPSRRWPLERFGELARRLVDHFDLSVLVLCGPGEQSLARQVTQHAACPRVVDMADQPLDLGTAKACIRRSSMMITTDSGPKHIAVAFGRPVVTLHGPVSPVETFNPSAKTIPVSLNLSCLNCQKTVCPLGHNACMRDMSVDYVFRHVLQARQQYRAAA